jgi:hypothetical protein
VQSEISYPIITLAGVLVALLVGYGARRFNLETGNNLGRGSPNGTKNLARFFHERVNHFKTQIQTLDEHSNEYTSIFRGDEWSELLRTIAQLEEADTRIQGWIVKREFVKAHKVLEEFYDPKKSSFDSIQADIDSITSSAVWESHVRGMLKRVVCNLETASLEVKQLSDPSKSRKRRPTLVTLADVKKSILEDEAFARE